MNPRRNLLAAVAASVLLLEPAAFAANGTWTKTAGGSWNSSGNWSGGTIANGSGFTADFSALNITSDALVNLNVDRTIGNLTFGDTTTSSAASWTLAAGNPGGKLTLAGTTPTITVNALGSGKYVTISAALNGTSGFTKAGTGQLILGNSSSNISGPVLLSAGILQLNAPALSNATTVAINAGTLVLATSSANAIGGTISFGGGLLQYENTPGSDDSGLFSTAANQNYRINTIGSVQVAYGSILSSSGGVLTKTGTGALTLAGGNTYSGGTTLSGGTLVCGNASALGSGPMTISGNSTLQFGGAFTLNNAVTISTGFTGTLDTNGNNTTLGGALAGSGNLAKNGLGALTLTGALNNTFSGAILVNAGTLRTTDGTSFKNMTGAVTVASGATFDFGQNFISANPLTNALILSGDGTGGDGALNLDYNATSSGPITLAADATISHEWNNATISGGITGADKNLVLNCTKSGQGPLTISGNISLGTGTLTKTGPNSVTLNGTNNYGSAVIETGVLYFQNAAAMGGSGSNITIQDNGVAARNGTDLENLILRVNSASTGAVAFGGSATTASNALNLSTHPSLSIGSRGAMAYSGTITPGGGNYRLGGGGGTLTVSSTLTGANGVIINDAQGGTVILTGTRDYTGGTVIKSGTLRVNGALNGNVSLMSGGTLAPGPASGTGSLTLDQALTVNGNLSMRIDRAAIQKADLLTAPALTFNGTLTVVNTGAALQAGDTFQLFSLSGGIIRNNLTLNLPTLAAGLAWNIGSLLSSGTLTVEVISNVVGYPDFPDLLPSQLQAVRDAGYTSATINPGTYRMPDLLSNQNSFTLSGWSNFTINADDVIITVGPQRVFMLTNCSNVKIQGLTIRRHYPSSTQGRVLSKGTNTNGTAYAIWRISDGYPMFATDADYVPVANEVRADFAINAVDGTTGIINRLAGDTYNCILTPQGNNTWKVDFPGKTSLPFSVNDWLVTRIQNSPPQGIFLSNSTNCTIESVTSQNAGFASFFEQGGGGNKLIGCKVERSPVIPPGATDPYVVSSASDGVHCRDAYPGMYIENFVTTGVLLDDCIAIHGVFVTVTAVSGNTITVDGISKLAVGDPVRISHDVSGYFAQATCTAITNIGAGSYNVTLDQALPIPVTSRVANPKYDGDGFRIINCQLSGTRSRAIITKADNGLISGCTIEHSGTAIKLGPEYYWNESGYVWNVTVENNTMVNCGRGVDVVADGSIGNKNIIVRDNTFGTTILSYAISLEGCDGVTISGNNFGVPSAAEIIRLQSSRNITMANNLVAYSAGGKSIVSTGSGVTAVQGSANGMLYSGAAYSLANSLSGLRLANPASNTAGDPVQQNSQTNATAHWFLQSDGNGHAKMVSAANGLVLGVNNSSSSGAPLILEADGAGLGQLWTLKPVGASTIELVNQLSGFSATVQTTAPSEIVSQTTGISSAGQLWTPSLNTNLTQNAAPVWTSSPVTGANAAEDAAYSGTLAGNATDANGNNLNYAKVSGPAWLNVAANGALSGMPANSDVGANSFTVSVTDGIAAPVQATLNITVINTNDAPTWLDNPLTGASATEDAAYSGTLAGSASDVDAGATLVFAKVSGPAWLSIASDGTLSGAPANSDVGANGFTVSVTDGIAAPVQATLNITVINTNDAPVFSVSPIVAAGATENVAYTGQSLAGQATDADAGDTITYSKFSGPAWLSVAPDGSLSGTPGSGTSGLNSFVVRATDNNSATADATLQITVTGLLQPWVAADIGAGQLAGSATCDAGTFTQTGSGVIGSTSDKLNFTYQTLSGDGEIIARISNLQNTGNSSRVGVMIRETLSANSKQIFMGMTGSGAYRWVRRTTTGGNTSTNNSSTGTVPNTWVRLVRSGTTITAYKSAEGTSWTAVGSTTNTSFASTCYIGLAVGSGSDTSLNTSQFSNVSVTP